MARVSKKDQKTLYQIKREELGLSREKASELLGAIPPERIERIESGKFVAHPDEVLLMAQRYGAPELCNAYCSGECAIGKKYVPPVEIKDLSRIVLEMLASLNRLQTRKDRLIEITADERIEAHEVADFVAIQQELERLSVSVETLQLWAEQKVSAGSTWTPIAERRKPRSRPPLVLDARPARRPIKR